MHEQFKNEKCAACGMKFFDDEDIVVCPECGAPYHRECWNRVGTCIHSAEHGSYEWKGDSAELREQTSPKQARTALKYSTLKAMTNTVR